MSDSAVLALSKALIQRPSVTPADEGCQDLMSERLGRVGFQCESLRFEDVDNLWAAHGSSGPLVVFAGHTDVVPTGPEAQWSSSPFEPQVRDGILYGRGAADMKGSLAAMLLAAESFVASPAAHSIRLGFLITSDEEGPATNGTVKVMQALAERGEHIDYCIVGEPSSTERVGDVIKNGRRGSLNGRLTVVGTQGHIAYPHLADNPIHAAMPMLARLCAEQWDEGNEFFQPSSFQISNISAGTGASNVIAGELLCDFNFRFSPESTESELKSRTEKLLSEFGQEFHIDWTLSGNPFITGHGRLLAACDKAISRVTGYAPTISTGGGTSDGRFIAPYGAELVELGPVNASIHKVDEHVRVADLEMLVSCYEELLKELAAP
ncbi:MAG: succinyl-diaminopimelate desuccinylase [Pseudomonadales bacterium]